jgi:predicted PurR-regulated permease PerM
MPASKSFSDKTRSHPFIFLAALIVAGILIYPFITPLILSVMTAYVLMPVVKWLEVRTHSHRTALIILVVIIGLPIIFAVSYLSSNIALFLQDISGFGDQLNAIIKAISDVIAGAGLGTYAGYFLGAQDITSRITALASSLAMNFVTNIPSFLLSFIIYLYATYHFMHNWNKIIDYIKAYTASLSSEDKHFFTSIQRGLKMSFDVLLLSYITMSVIVTAVSFIVYAVFGAPHALLLSILTGLFSILPILGTWMVYVPVSAYMYYTGNIFSAAGIMIFGVVVLTAFIPYILYPYLGAKTSGVSALTIFLGVFSGPIIFGTKGLLLGPILFVITETIIVEYMRYRISGHEDENSDQEHADI